MPNTRSVWPVGRFLVAEVHFATCYRIRRVPTCIAHFTLAPLTPLAHSGQRPNGGVCPAAASHPNRASVQAPLAPLTTTANTTGVQEHALERHFTQTGDTDSGFRSLEHTFTVLDARSIPSGPWASLPAGTRRQPI